LTNLRREPQCKSLQSPLHIAIGSKRRSPSCSVPRDGLSRPLVPARAAHQGNRI
jgi:hypothetical protein